MNCSAYSLFTELDLACQIALLYVEVGEKFAVGGCGWVDGWCWGHFYTNFIVTSNPVRLGWAVTIQNKSHILDLSAISIVGFYVYK